MCKKKVPCLHCGLRPAKLPADLPRFCRYTCGYAWAVLHAGDMRWCPKHSRWYTGLVGTGGSCPYCWIDGREAQLGVLAAGEDGHDK